jgi:hypothetical protein
MDITCLVVYYFINKISFIYLRGDTLDYFAQSVIDYVNRRDTDYAIMIDCDEN